MTLHPRLPLAGLLILLLAPTLWAQPDSEPSTPEAVIQQIETALLPKVRVVGRDVAPATLQERMAFHGVPAVSIAVIDQGKIAWAKAYGLADVEAGRAATTETLFQSASMSKPVATMTALQLVQDGLLELDGPINESLASWQLPASAFTAEQPVTLRHLMTHTAGTTVSGFPGYAATDSVPTTMQVLDGESPANTQAVRSFAKPGHSFRYSGGGMTIMQLAMADVTETSFVELTRERMLGPAGMERSTYAQPLPAARALEAATAYDSDGTPIAGRYHTYPEMAAAGLWTTPTEYAGWILTVNEAVAGASDAVLSQALTDSMLTPNSNGWGLGMPVNGTGDALAFMHGGSNAGYKCQMVGYPHRGQGAVVMTNSDTGSALVDELMTALHDAYDWPIFAPTVVTPVSLDETTLKAIAGTYQQFGNTDIPIRLEEGKLIVYPPGITPRELVPISDTQIVDIVDGEHLTIERDEEGTITGIKASWTTLKRVSE